MKKPTIEHYHARMQRVIDYIDDHLDEGLDLDRLSDLSAFSKYHFHRQFTAIFGIPVHRYVHLCRMKHASFRLAFRDNHRITDIGLDAGYEASEAFARAFRQCFGQAPSRFRKSPDWASWLQTLKSLDQARSTFMPRQFLLSDVDIVELEARHIACMPHHGDPAKIGDTVQAFIAWRKQERLLPKTSATFNLFYNDPETVPPDEFRMDICAGVESDFGNSNPRIHLSTIPGGSYARLRVSGIAGEMPQGASFLYREWLPASGRELRDFPFFCERVRFFADVAEADVITDLYLPLA